MRVNGRFRNWVFTLNHPAHALTPEIDFVGSAAKFMVWQLEIGEAANLHYQGYIELDRPCSLHQMRELGSRMLLGAHFEVIYFAPFYFFCARSMGGGLSVTFCMWTVASSPLWSWLTRQSCAARAAPPSSSWSVPVFWSSGCSPSTK